MKKRLWYIRVMTVVALVAIGLTSSGLSTVSFASQANRASEGVVESAVVQEAPDAPAAPDTLALSYAAKFVCREAAPPGTFWAAGAAPVVQEKTDVLVHNPNGFGIKFYKKAVVAPLETYDADPVEGTKPGNWKDVALEPDRAFTIDCDDIAKLLTGNAAATFVGTYGIGVKVEGFVVILVGPQQNTAGQVINRGVLNVTAEYVRSSEVMKKDINYQPWWVYWPYLYPTLPWRLGYAYQRLLTIEDPTHNIDCRADLIAALKLDTAAMGDTLQREETVQALDQGVTYDPNNVPAQSQKALVPLIGRCDKVTPTVMSVDYVLVSNITNSTGYPWISGRWYDLALIVPQNLDIDIHDYFRQWQRQRWITAGGAASVDSALAYYFPYWCGWGYWWWWWNAGDCIDIGVGDGESLDVEQVTPQRVFMPTWPPPNP